MRYAGGGGSVAAAGRGGLVRQPRLQPRLLPRPLPPTTETVLPRQPRGGDHHADQQEAGEQVFIVVCYLFSNVYIYILFVEDKNCSIDDKKFILPQRILLVIRDKLNYSF